MSNITIRNSSGEKKLLTVENKSFIDIQKGDYIFIPEKATSLKFEIINDSLKIIFENGDNIILNNLVKLIAENNNSKVSDLLDKMDTTSIAFMNDNGDYIGIDFFEKLLSLIEASAAGDLDGMNTILGEEIVFQKRDSIAFDETNNDRSDFERVKLLREEIDIEENYERDDSNSSSDSYNTKIGLVSLSANSEVSEDGGVITYTVNLNTTTESQMNITLSNGVTIIIPAGQSIGSVDVIINEDDVYNDQSVKVVDIDSIVGGGFDILRVSNASVSTDILDDVDTTTVTLTTTNVNEDTATATFTITLSNAPQTDVTVTTEHGDVVIPAGETSATFTVDTLDSDVYLDASSVSATVSNVVGGNFENVDYSSATATAQVADTIDTTTVTLTTTNVNEDTATATFTITLSNPGETDVTVTTEHGDVVIPAGETSATFTVDTLDSDVYLDASSVSATVSNVVGGNFENVDYSSATATAQVADTIDTTTVTLTTTNVNEDTATATFTITLSNPGETDVTVTTEHGDVVIPAGETSATFTVDTLDSDVYLDASSVSATVSNVVGGNFENVDYSSATATAQVADTIDTTTVTLTTTNVNEDTATATFTITLSNPGETDVTVTTEHGDVVIPAGETSATFTVDTLDSDVYLDASSVSATVSNVVGGNFENVDYSSATATAQVADTIDTTTVTLTTTNVNEDTATATFTITLSNPGETDVTVTTEHGDVVIPAGETSATFTVDTLDSDVYLDASSVSATVSNVVGGNFENVDYSSATATAQVADTIDTTTVTLTTTNVNEDTATATFTITLSNPGETDVTVTTEHGDVVIPAGETSATFTVDTLDSDVYLDASSVSATVSNVVGGNFENVDYSSATATAQVADTIDTTTVTLTTTNVNEDTATATFTITLSNAPQTDVTVTTEHGDVVIPAGETSATFTVNTLDSDVYLDASSVSATVSNVVGGNFENVDYSNATATAQVADTIDTTTVTISGDTSISEGNQATYTISVTNAPQITPLVVTLTVGHVTTENGDITPLTETVTIPVGQTSVTYSVDSIDNSVANESDKEFIVSITNTSGGNYENLVVGNSSISTTIVEDDIANDPDAVNDDLTTGTIVLVNETFEDGATGWSDNSVTQTDGNATDFLGRFSGTGGNEGVSKTFDLGVENAGKTVTIEFDMYEIDSWDDEQFMVFINNQMVESDYMSHFGRTWSTNATDEEDGGELLDNIGSSGANHLDYDEKHHYELEVTLDENGQVTLGFGSTLNSSISDESWGIDNVVISMPSTEIISITEEDTAVIIEASTLLVNDSDVDGDTLTISSVQNPINGTVSLDSNGNVVFTPDVNYNGEASFTYTISDGNGGTDTATVTLNVSSVNDVPVIDIVSTATVNEDNTLTINSNEWSASDIEDGNLTPVLSANNGTVDIDENGNIVYTPNENYNGSDVISVSVTDSNGVTTTKEIAVTVVPVDDASILDVDTNTINEDTSASGNVLTNDSDIDNDLSVSTFSINGTSYNAGQTATIANVGSVVINANGEYSFTPLENYNGDIPTISYTTNTGVTSTLDIKVNAVNDGPIAVDDMGTTTIEINKNGTDGKLLFDSRGDNPELLGGATEISVTIDLIGESNQGQASLLSYNSATQDNELLIFSDGNHINLYIDGRNVTTSINAADVFDNTEHSFTVTWDSETGEAKFFIDGDLKDTQIIGQGHVIDSDGVLVFGQEQDSLDGGYATQQIFEGEYNNISISVDGNEMANWDMSNVQDGKVIDSVGNFDLTISGDVVENAIGTEEDTAVTIEASTLLVNDSDVDGDTLTISSVQNPINGTVSLDSNGNVVFTPDVNYNGEASFTYTISDGNGGTDTATVTLNVSSVNDVPVIDIVSTATVNEDNTLTINSNEWSASDIEDGNLTPVLSANNGTVDIDENGNIVYTPNENYNGSDVISVSVTDSNGVTTTKEIAVTVVPVDDASILDVDTNTINEDTSASGNVLTNDSDIDNDLSVSTFSINGTSYNAGQTATIANVGSVVINTNGEYSFIPVENYNGDIPTISYTTNTGVTSTLDITVNGVNDGPDAIDDGVQIAKVWVSDSVKTTIDSLQIGTFGNETSEVSDWGIVNEDGKAVFTSGDVTVITSVSEGTLTSYNSLNTSIGVGIGNEDDAGLDKSETLSIEIDGGDANSISFTLSGLGGYFDETSANATEILITAYDEDGNIIETQGGYRESGNYEDTYSFETNVPVSKFEITSQGSNGNFVVKNMTITATDNIELPGHYEYVYEDTSSVIRASDLLANDTDIDGDTLEIVSVQGATHGTVSLNEDGNVVFVPDENYNGEATFTYTISDGNGGTDTATVTLDVVAVNDGPTTTDDSVTTNEDTTYTFTTNDFGTYSDVENDLFSAVKIESQPTNGIILLNGIAVNAGDVITLNDISNGNLTFEPTSNSDVDANFNFRVSDGTDFSELATTTINIEAVVDTPATITLDVSREGDDSVVYSNTNAVVNDNLSSVATIDGVNYSMSFDYSGSEVVNVYFGGEIVGTIDGSSSSDVTHTLDITGLGGVEELSFKDINGNDISVSSTFMAPLENMIEYSVDLSASLTDTDGSESLQIKLENLPEGATLSIGEAGSEEGTWIIDTSDTSITLTGIKMFVPESADTFTLEATAISTESNGDIATTTTVTSSVIDVSLNSAATSTDDSVTAVEDTTLVLSKDDFGTFSDVDGDSFVSIKITDLPEGGTLKLLGQDNPNTTDGSVILEVGDVINVSDIDLGNLVYIPISNSSDTQEVEFRVGDGKVYSDNSYTTTINIDAVADEPIIDLSIGDMSSETISGQLESITENIAITNASFEASNHRDGNYDFDIDGWDETGNSGDWDLNDYRYNTSTLDGENVAFLGRDGTMSQTLSETLANDTTYSLNIDVGHLYNGGINSSYTINLYAGNQLIGTINQDDISEVSGKLVTATLTVDTSTLADNFSGFGEALKIEVVNGNHNYELDLDNVVLTKTYETGTPDITVNKYPIDITTALTDTDGSETLSDVSLSGIPSDGVLKVDGVEVDVIDGVATLTQTQITGDITLEIPSTSSQTFDLVASVTSMESSNSDSEVSSVKASHIEVDDAPIAIDETETISVNEATTATQDTNIVMVLDLSGSMSWDGDSSTSGVQSRLSLAKEAIENMINAYDNLGEVNVKLTTFSSSGTTSSWMSASDAINVINSLSASGSTNYEDALYETYNNFTQPDADKTVGFFISDGEPTAENTEGRDVSGNVGKDAESGWIDSSYQTAWTEFVNNNLDELNVIGIGTGISNTTYLEQIAQGTDSSVKVNTMLITDVTELKESIVPNVETISGTIADNINYGSDGKGAIVSITIDGVTYTASNFPSSGVTTTEGGKLTFDFDTGNYEYQTVSIISEDYVERFEVVVSDADGDTTTMNLVMNVNLKDTVSEVSVVVGDEVISTTASTNNMDLEFTSWSGVSDYSNSTGELNSSVSYGDGNDTLYINGNANAAINLGNGDNSLEITGSVNSDSSIYSGTGEDNIMINDLNSVIDSGSGNDKIVINGSVNSNGEVITGDGDDKITIKRDLNNDISTGTGNDQVQIDGNVNSDAVISTGSGNNTVDIDGQLNGRVDGGTGSDRVTIAGNINSSALVQLGNGNDILQVDSNVWGVLNGGDGTDSLILGNYTKAQYDSNYGGIQSKIIGFENIKFKDGQIIGDASAFDFDSSSATTTYSYDITLSSDLAQNSEITVENIPSGATLKDSLGNELTANNDGTYTVQADANGDINLSIESDTSLDESALNSISAKDATASEDSVNYGSSDDEIIFEIDTEVDGGEGTDTLVFEENSILDFDSLVAQNIEVVNIENNNQIDSSTLDVSDVINMTDDDNILTIIGDAGDEIGLTNEDGSTKWEKSDEQVQSDDGDIFDVWTNNDVTVYIDEDITVTDI